LLAKLNIGLRDATDLSPILERGERRVAVELANFTNPKNPLNGHIDLH
jgi:hypothetical protein